MYPVKPFKWSRLALPWALRKVSNSHLKEIRESDKFYSYVKGKEVSLEDHGGNNSRYLCVLEAIQYVKCTKYAIDVGCREGEYTRYLARYFDHCYAFDYRFRPHFFYNVNVKKITQFNCPLGQHTGVIKASGRGNIRAKKIDREWLPGEGGRAINIYRLDEFGFRDVGLLKVDVDGMDEEVLRGAQCLIREYKPVIIVEQQADSTHDAVGYLIAEFGYEIKFKTSIDWVLA